MEILTLFCEQTQGVVKKKECSAEIYHLIDALFGLRPDDLVNAGFFHNCELENSLKGRQADMDYRFVS